MKTRTKILTSIVAIILSSVLLFIAVTVINNKKTTPNVQASIRTVELSVLPNYDNYLKDFTEKSITSDDDSVSFHGIMDYDEKVLDVFDQVALADGIDTTQSKIVYDCSFDIEAMQFTFKSILLDENGEMLEIEEIVTDAFVTSTGQLDAYIELDGETYLLSEYVSTDAIEECLFKLLKKIVTVIVVVYVVVAETAEQIKAKSNYKYNKELESSGKGVAKGLPITNQDYGNQTINSGKYNSTGYPANYYPADYKFGFTTFSKVGCEVASVYNLLIALGKAENLSETIYNFEKWAIEISIGWGKLGSNPKDIYRYLNKKNINYSKYTSYSSFKKALAGKNKCHVIMSTWNNGGMLKSIFSGEGLHTYYMEKVNISSSTYKFDTYNLRYDYACKSYNSIDEIYNMCGDFIVAYIIS